MWFYKIKLGALGFGGIKSEEIEILRTHPKKYCTFEISVIQQQPTQSSSTYYTSADGTRVP